MHNRKSKAPAYELHALAEGKGFLHVSRNELGHDRGSWLNASGATTRGFCSSFEDLSRDKGALQPKRDDDGLHASIFFLSKEGNLPEVSSVSQGSGTDEDLELHYRDQNLKRGDHN